MQSWTFTFQPVFNKDTHDLFYVVHSAHVPVNRVDLLLFFDYFVRCLIFLSSFVRLLFSIRFFCFHLFIVRCSKEKDIILILDCIPGILILFIIIYASQ